MANLSKRVRRDTFIWAAIIAGHGLLLIVVLRIEDRTQWSKPDAAVTRSFIWLSVPSPLNGRSETQPVALIPKPLHPEAEPRSPPEAQPTPPPEAISRIDWTHEAAVSAAGVVRADAAASMPKTFSPAPEEMRKPCQPHKSSMVWQRSRVGMAGSDGGLYLPYVKLGKRCVLGLGFFGCALGQLPEPNSHLLDDMHDPDLSRDSEPAIDRCE